MAHYAFIDGTGLVVEVITGVDEDQVVNGITGTDGWEQFYATQRPGLICKRTSYNGNIRYNYAGIGYFYDSGWDAFVPPRPYPSWTLNTDTFQWSPPVPYPTDGGMHVWDEATQTWEPADG